MELGLGHLADGVVGGFMAGRRIKREDERAVQDTEERGLRMDAMRTSQENDAVDRDFTLQQRERAVSEQQTKDGLRDFFRKVSPLVEAGQDDAAMEVIGQEYKNNPIFADGHYAEADKDEKGAFIKDKDGNYSVSYFTEDGKPTGQKRAVKPEQALVSMLDYFDPEEAIKRKQSSAAETAKDAREHNQQIKLEDVKHDNAMELAQLNNDSRAAIQQLRIDALESGKTGRLVSVADRGKMAVELAKTFKDDRAYRGKTPAQRLQEARVMIDSLYGDPAEVAAPAPAPAAAAPKPAAPQFVRTGTKNGRKVGQLPDGTIVDIATGKAVK